MSSRSLARGAALCLVAAAACNRVNVPVVRGMPVPVAGRGAPRNGLEVIGWMRYAHPSRALKTLTFTLSATDYRGDTTSTSARAHAVLPGRLRVSQLPAARKTAYVRNRQRVALFERGERSWSANRVDLVALLAYDVFAQSIDTTIMWLDSSTVRFGLARRDVLDGRDVWVVGAAEGDTTSAQFWVDADRWRVVRVIQREPRLADAVIDTRFTEFTELLDTPVPVRAELRRAGRVIQRQVMSEHAANPRVSTRIFDVSRWRDAPGGD